jgi:phytanoyl-CoA hydroxylase
MEPLELILGTWTALDEATPENGCMHVIPGSHTLGPKPHYHERDCQLPDDVVESQRSIMVPLKPGG